MNCSCSFFFGSHSKSTDDERMMEVEEEEQEVHRAMLNCIDSGKDVVVSQLFQVAQFYCPFQFEVPFELFFLQRHYYLYL